MVFESVKDYFEYINIGQKELQKALGQGFDSSKIDDYVKVLGDLDIAQKRAIITSSDLSESEKKQMLERINNTVVTKANSAANLENASSDIVDANSNKANIKTTNDDSVATKINTELTRENTVENLKNSGSDNIDSFSNIMDQISDKFGNVGSVISGIIKFIKGNFKLLSSFGIVFAGIAQSLWYQYRYSAKGIIEENKKIIDSNKEVRDSLTEEIDNNKNKASNLQSLYEDYMTAKKGSDEYYRAANSIADLSKDLVIGYDNEGNAIIANNEKIKDQIQYYKDLAKAKQEALRYEAIGTIDEEQVSYQEVKNKRDEQQTIVDNAKKTVDEYQEKYDKSGDQTDLDDLNLLKEQYYKELTTLNELSVQVGEAEASLRESYTNLLPVADNLSDSQKAIREGLIDTAITEGWSSYEFDEVFKELEKVDASAIIKLQLDESLTDEEYRTQALKIYENLAAQFKLTDEAKQAFKVAFGIDEETIKKAEETRKNNVSLIGEKLGNSINQDDGTWSGDQDIENWINGLSDEDISLLLSGEFDENTTLSELEDLLEKLQKQANEKPIKTNVEILSGVESLSKGLDQLDEIYADVIDGKDFDYSSILNNEDFKETFGGYTEEYNNFIETVADSPKDIKACQEAFNKLATAYIYNSEKLNDVTDETKDATIAFLKQKGVVNAEAIVLEVLASKKEFLAYAGKELTDATDEEIASFIEEANTSEQARAAIVNFAMAKYNANNLTLATDGDISNLLRLAKACGTTSKALDILQRLKAGEKINIGGKEGYEYIKQQAERELEELAKVSYNTNVNYGGGTASQAAKEAASETKETFDWVETLISRLQRTITNLGKTVSATWQKWTDRNNALGEQFKLITDEIDVMQQAYDRYKQEADNVGLSEEYQKLVINGGLDIETITDESLKEKIQEFQEWYDKMLECEDAITDLRDELAQLARTKFDNIAKEFDDKMNVNEHQSTMLEGYLDKLEAQGYIASSKYYEKLKELEAGNKAMLEQEYVDLKAALDEAVASGSIKEGSEEWYAMMQEIYGVEEAIQDSELAMIEFENAIRDLEWELFDKMQEMKSQIQAESDFLIDLMSNEKMFDDEGNWTEYADATAGLHAINYNAYMAQADDYAKEIEEIDKQLAEDPYNQDLLERRQELLEQQRDMILSAEEEKQAMIDLVREGYDAMLGAMQELIDKKKEALQAEKDLYSYQKKVEEQTKNIASLEKQLAAYEGDDSEETQSKIQQIKLELEEARQDLEETEYDQWLSDQQLMLDNMYSEAEEWVNERMDNVDALLQEMIDSANENAGAIAETLEEVSGEVGYDITEGIGNIFNGEDGIGKIVEMYGDNFSTALTTTNSTLASIEAYIKAMIGASDEQASEDIENVEPSEPSEPSQPVEPVEPTVPSEPEPSEPQSSWGSWFVGQEYKGNKNNLDKEKSIVDKIIVHVKRSKLRETPESLNNQAYIEMYTWRLVTESVW